MMSGNAQSKFVNEYNSKEDVNNYKEEYKTDLYYHCGNCYCTHRCRGSAPLAESESLEEDLLTDAIEVWKIYKLLQRMKKCI